MDKQLKKLIDERDLTISRINEELERTISGTQKKLLEDFMTGFADKLQTDGNGVVLNNTYNRNLLLSLDKMFSDFTKKNAPVLIHEIISGVGSIMDFNSRFYSNFEGEAKLLPIRKKVRENVGAWLGLKDGEASENGYLRTLVESDTARSAIKNVAMKTILSQDGFFTSKQKLRDLIDGDDERMGAMQKYYRNFTYDLYSQVDRATAKTYADGLKFEFAIYEGGLIDSSRKFCQKHNGQVFHKSEIAKFKLTEAEPPNYNPFTDLGGHGCRHHLNWIPNSLAFMMRPDARKFVEGEKTEPAPAPEKKAEPKPKKAEPVREIEVEAIKPAISTSAITPENRDLTVKKYHSMIDEASSPKEFKAIMQRIAPMSRGGSVRMDASPEIIRPRLKSLTELFADYNVGYNIDKFRLSSGARSHGFVQRNALTGEILEANYGHTSDKFMHRKRYEENDINLGRAKSAVDEVNVEVATVVHEFAHTLTDYSVFSYQHRILKKAGNDVTKIKDYEFWSEMEKLQKEYFNFMRPTKLEIAQKKFKLRMDEKLSDGERKKLAREIKDLEKQGAEVYLGDYASENIDEFLAEAFTEYKLSSKPSKYAKAVGKLVDQHFKK